MAETDEPSESAGTDEGRKGWLGNAAAITGLITALTGLIAAVRHSPSNADSTPTPTATASVPLAARHDRPRVLMWGPADCAGDPAPSVAVDSCADRRPLGWLTFEMDQLRSGGQFGFGALPKGFRLQSSDYNGKSNYVLSVLDQDGKRSFTVGVGYNVKTGAKDGALRLYLDGHVVGEAWLKRDNTWTTTPPTPT